MAITVDSILGNIDVISKRLEDNVLIKAAKDAVKEEMGNAEISSEEQGKIYANFAQQISLSLVTEAIKLSSEIPLLTLKEQELQAAADKAVYDKLQSLAALKKQYGYKDADANGLGNSSGDGLIDKQIIGFFKDQVYKGVKTFSEQAAMLAQNDVPTPSWMVDYMKIGAEMLSDGKINLKVVGEGDSATTEVNYDGDATEANGLGA